MITLATLPFATEQEVFDQVVRHLLTQKEKAMNDTESKCRYRTSKGLTCAAGCLIAEEEYSYNLENKSWGTLVERKLVPDAHDFLILELQKIHDNEDVSDWPLHLRSCGECFNLNTSVLDNHV